MINNKKRAEKLLEIKRIQAILTYFDKKPYDEIRYAVLRKEFHLKYKNWKKLADGCWHNPKNPDEKKTIKPEPYYIHEYPLLRHLNELVDYGFLKVRKIDEPKKEIFTYYRLSKKYIGEGLRIQNKSAFDIYPLEQINKIPSKEDEPQHMLYGFSEKMISELEMEDKKQLDNEIQKVITSINKIEKIHDKHRGKKLNELRSNFMENTSNIKIKRLLKNNYWQFIGCISELIGANYNYRYSISRKAIRFNIENWIQNVPEIIKYNFSKKDISELAEFAIMNHKVFCDMEPLSIAFSRYVDLYDNLLLKYH